MIRKPKQKRVYKENKNKNILSFLNSYKGVGLFLSKKISSKFGISCSTRFHSLDKQIKQRLLVYMKSNYSVNLRKKRREHFYYLKNIKHLKGLRFNFRLPINSKRCKTNAKTRKKWNIF